MNVEIRVTGLQAHGVVLLSPENPDFDTLAPPMVGRMAHLALQLKPYVVIVSNQSPRVVVAFAIVWRVYEERGLVNTSSTHFKYPEAVCGDVLEGRRNGFLPPGRMRIVGNGCEVEGAGEYGETPDTWLDQFVAHKDAELAYAIGVEIELDAVIFDDGTLVGRNESEVAEHFGIYVNAKQDCYRRIRAAIDAGVSVKQAFSAVSEPFMGRLSLKEDPQALYARQAAAEASVARRHVGDQHIAEWIRQNVCLNPFIVARR